MWLKGHIMLRGDIIFLGCPVMIQGEFLCDELPEGFVCLRASHTKCRRASALIEKERWKDVQMPPHLHLSTGCFLDLQRLLLFPPGYLHWTPVIWSFKIWRKLPTDFYWTIFSISSMSWLHSLCISTDPIWANRKWAHFYSCRKTYMSKWMN